MSPRVKRGWSADITQLDYVDQGVANCSPLSSEEGTSPSLQSDSGGDDSAKENRKTQNKGTPKSKKGIDGETYLPELSSHFLTDTVRVATGTVPGKYSVHGKNFMFITRCLCLILSVNWCLYPCAHTHIQQPSDYVMHAHIHPQMHVTSYCFSQYIHTTVTNTCTQINQWFFWLVDPTPWSITIKYATQYEM